MWKKDPIGEVFTKKGVLEGEMENLTTKHCSSIYAMQVATDRAFRCMEWSFVT